MFTQCMKLFCCDSALETICFCEEENGNFYEKEMAGQLRNDLSYINRGLISI